MSTIEIPCTRTVELAPVASASGVTHTYGRVGAAAHALSDVSLEVGRGALTAIAGPAGSGKSTLLHVLAGLQRPTSGTVRIADVDIGSLKVPARRRLRREHVGFVYRLFNLLPALTAEENILRPSETGAGALDSAWVDELIGAAGLGKRRGTRAAELTRGQQQRVAIARALVPRPTVVFADDPAGVVCPDERDEVLELLHLLVSSYGQTIVIATEDAQAATIADRTLVLDLGVISEDSDAG
jgi:putative ABC transport system ATP-binding protein